MADFCRKRNWNLPVSRAPVITQSIEFAGISKFTHRSMHLLPLNMVHVGTKVKKIRTPWYLEVNKKNFLTTSKKWGDGRARPKFRLFSVPPSMKGSPKAALKPCLPGAVPRRHPRKFGQWSCTYPSPLTHANASTAAARLRAATSPRPPRRAARRRRWSARGRSCRPP